MLGATPMSFRSLGFAQQVATAERVHLVHGPRGGQHHARCRIRIQGSRSKIDYRPFRPYNTRHGMVPGLMELEFADATARITFAQTADAGVVPSGGDPPA